ncbi:MAG: FHA domain-containing protein [Gemmatimonadota bacterium]|nr:FHA domain-containing protein [Gemmatimonadota bacterium]
MPVKLTGTHGGHSFELREGTTLVVGRALGTDIPIVDPTVSRRHADVRCEGDEVVVRDLGSVNGTYVNGDRVTSATVRPGDVITFGALSFRLTAEAISARNDPTPDRDATPTSIATIVRQLRIGDRRPGATTLARDATETPVALAGEGEPDLNSRKLALLLDVSRELGRAAHTDSLLDRIGDVVFQVMDVDRVALMLADDSGVLVPKVSRDRWGTDAGRAVPRSIARTVVEDRVAILSDNAPEDARFGGHSILAQKVRSAMCAPLVGSEDRVLGVLYVDNLTTTHRFTDEDLDFLVAFSGIAAIAIENGAFAERIRREALVRSNFERYFAPALAARIAQTPGAVRLGGERKTVTVVFTDLRGFTALSAAMPPDDTAELLSEYLGAMVECVFRHGGVLDKFIGDGVMAQWGAPLTAPDDTDRAVRAARDMQRELAELNEKWRREGRPELQIGIGVDRGDVFAGNIGSERRLEFTVIGDAVNTANRLCECAAGGQILITEEVAQALREPTTLMECPPLELKGGSALRTVYRVGE